MKKDLKLFNRSLAIVVAAATVMTSAPSTLLAADLFSDGADVSVEEQIVEEAAAVDQVAADASAFISEEPVEVFVDEVTETAAVDTAEANVGTPGTPAKVTGVYVDTDGENVSYPTLRWNYVAGVYGYEISIADALGNEYVLYPDWKYDTATSTGKYETNYYMVYTGSATPSTVLANLDGLYAYTISADAQTVDRVYADAAKTTALTAMTAGQTYTLKVRAVNRYQATENDTAVMTPGEWSDAITYTVPATYTQASITNLRYASEDENYVYFDFDGDITAGELRYQVSTVADFSTYMSSGYVSSTSMYKMYVSKSSLSAGTTYYLRVANGVDGEYLEDAEGNTIWSNVVSFTVNKAADTPKAITGLTLYSTTNNAFEFRFDPVLESGDSYELQYSKDPNFAEGTVSYYSNGTTISKSVLEADVIYYVRAIAYKYTNGEKVYGTPSNVVTVSRAKLPTISNLTVAEKTSSAFVLKYTGNLNAECGVQFWISEDSSFASNPTTLETESTTDNNTFSISYSDLTPGKTYYVRARVYSSEDYDYNKAESYYYSDFTNTVSIKAVVPSVTVSSSAASTSITLKAYTKESGPVTGYQFQKKVGKKYQTLGKTTDGTYADKKLTANTSYTYRVRAYYVDEDTNKTYYGSWTTYSTMTWGGNLNLTAAAKSKTSVKLSWNKVSGAKGYEVYRTVTMSDGTQGSADTGSNGYTKWVLVKTITKASTKSCTIKGLTAGCEYGFKVRAYRTVDNKKYYIDGTDYVNLSFDLSIKKVKENANGSVKLTWNPVYAGNGYLVEVKDNATDDWSTYKTITKASTSSITLPAAADESVTYRIRAYKNGTPKTYSNAYMYTVDPVIAAPTGVSAKANKADGSITVSWKAVAGADFYKVYRTTRPSFYYDKDTKTYSYSVGTRIYEYVADASSRSGYRLSSEDLTATTIVDRPIKYTNVNGIEKTVNEGPKAGVKYYYYVVACKYEKSYQYETENSISSGASKSASATVTNVTVSKTSIRSLKSSAKGRAVLTWKKVSGADGYEVYRSTKKSKGYTKIATITKGSTVKYTDKTATSGKKYYYKVRVVKQNEAGVDVYSSYSSVKSVKVK